MVEEYGVAEGYGFLPRSTREYVEESYSDIVPEDELEQSFRDADKIWKSYVLSVEQKLLSAGPGAPDTGAVFGKAVGAISPMMRNRGLPSSYGGQLEEVLRRTGIGEPSYRDELAYELTRHHALLDEDADDLEVIESYLEGLEEES